MKPELTLYEHDLMTQTIKSIQIQIAMESGGTISFIWIMLYVYPFLVNNSCTKMIYYYEISCYFVSNLKTLSRIITHYLYT